MTCSTCGGDSKRFRKGLCTACYERARRADRGHKGRPRFERKPCIVDGCERITKDHPVNGRCNRHYDEQKRRREGIMPRVKKLPEQCKEPDCDRFSERRRMCMMHYHRWLRAYHSGNPIYRKAAEMPAKTARGVWTIGPEKTILCWPPRNAGLDWRCTCGRTREETP